MQNSSFKYKPDENADSIADQFPVPCRPTCWMQSHHLSSFVIICHHLSSFVISFNTKPIILNTKPIIVNAKPIIFKEKRTSTCSSASSAGVQNVRFRSACPKIASSYYPQFSAFLRNSPQFWKSTYLRHPQIAYGRRRRLRLRKSSFLIQNSPF